MTNKEKNKYAEQPDDFSLRIKNKLDDFQMPVDTDIWDNIQTQIAPRPKRMWLRWTSSAAAIAAIVAITFLIIPDKAPISNIVENHQKTNTISPPIGQESSKANNEKEIVDEVDNTGTNTQVQHPQTVLASNYSPQTTETTIISENGETELTKQNETFLGRENNTSAPSQEEKVNTEENLTDKDFETKEPITKQTLSNNKSDSRPYLLPEKKSQNDGWLLAASMNSSGSSSNGVNILSAMKNSDYDPEMLGNADKEPVTFKDPGSANTKKLSSDDFSNIEHDIPLSFGITVRKDLNKYIGLETGLVYTYLSSKMERTNVPQYKAKQELHYLGIPVNVVVNLWNDPKWNVYVSGGGMIEKGLKQKYTQEMYQSNNMTSSITDDGSVSGVQLSLSASAGVSYAFYQKLSLYVEPRISYYFDNDQPISVRTDKKTVFGIGAGIRYKF